MSQVTSWYTKHSGCLAPAHTHTHTQPFYSHYTVSVLADIPVENWRILLEQISTARMPLLTANSVFRLWSRCYSPAQWHYLDHLCTTTAWCQQRHEMHAGSILTRADKRITDEARTTDVSHVSHQHWQHRLHRRVRWQQTNRQSRLTDSSISPSLSWPHFTFPLLATSGFNCHWPLDIHNDSALRAVMITSAKEDMWSSLFVCLSVC